MLLTIADMTADGPSYQEIADDLRRRIRWGEIRTRQYLAERGLMDRYGASRDTIREVIEVLTAEKLLKSKPGDRLEVTGTVDPLAFVPDANRASASRGPRPAASPVRGAWLRITAVSLQVVLPAGVIYLITSMSGAKYGPVLLYLLFPCGVLFLAARRLDIRGRQYRAPVVASLAELADGEFVLYLRSFGDDDSLARHIEWSGFGGEQDLLMNLGLSGRTEEEQLVAALRPAGSVVALGSPGEKLPPAGARRIYPSAEAWQDTVIYLMERARLVVLVLGPSRGLMWELAQAAWRLPPARLAVIVLMPLASYEEFEGHVTAELRDAARQLRRSTGQVWSPPILPDFPLGEPHETTYMVSGADAVSTYHAVTKLPRPWLIRFAATGSAKR